MPLLVSIRIIAIPDGVKGIRLCLMKIARAGLQNSGRVAGNVHRKNWSRGGGSNSRPADYEFILKYNPKHFESQSIYCAVDIFSFGFLNPITIQKIRHFILQS